MFLSSLIEELCTKENNKAGYTSSFGGQLEVLCYKFKIDKIIHLKLYLLLNYSEILFKLKLNDLK